MSQEGIFLGDNVFLSFSDDGVDDAYILGDNRLSSYNDDLREMETIHRSHGGIFLGNNVFFCGILNVTALHFRFFWF